MSHFSCTHIIVPLIEIILTISFLIVINIQIIGKYYLSLNWLPSNIDIDVHLLTKGSDLVSRLRTERLRLFHSLTVAETKESLVKDSLQNRTIISLPFRRG
jgi:hypothetical protein